MIAMMSNNVDSKKSHPCLKDGELSQTVGGFEENRNYSFLQVTLDYLVFIYGNQCAKQSEKTAIAC